MRSGKVWFAIAVAVFGILPYASCGRNQKVSLSIDLSKASQWNYLLGVDIKGELGQGDSTKVFTGSVRTYLRGDVPAHDLGVVSLRTSETRVVANFMDDLERNDLERRFEGMSLTFSPREGAVYVPDTARLPSVNIGGWDLFRNFARVLPVLPESRVAIGATWERERQFPIETSHGSAIGHLFQSFHFDSIVVSDSTPRAAALSWLFSYRIELLSTDSIGIFKPVPLKGDGRGQALVAIDDKELLRAHASFSAPADTAGPSPIVWSESVHLEMVD